ncbi:MAG: hypothetical protein PHD73_08365 [Sediminibacterium sp.]|nr:hypothetical protein [Sediminibacterium sp.]
MFPGSDSNDYRFRMLKHEYSYTSGRKSAVYANNGNRILLGETTEILMGLLPVYGNKLEFVGLDFYSLANENTAGLSDRIIKKLQLSSDLLQNTGILLAVTNRAFYTNIKAGITEVFGQENMVADFTNRLYNNDAKELQHILLFIKDSKEAKNTELLNRSFWGKQFKNMMPADLIRYCVYAACSKEAIVLNAIGNCEAMAAPVLNLNKQDKGNRKILLLCPANAADDYTNFQPTLASETDFDCYVPGNSLFLNDSSGQLNAALPAKQIREYIWYTETEVGFIDNRFSPSEPYLLGIQNNTAIYLLYEYDAKTVLNQAFLLNLKTTARQYIVYAHCCELSSEQLLGKKIQFKQIPEDICHPVSFRRHSEI